MPRRCWRIRHAILTISSSSRLLLLLLQLQLQETMLQAAAFVPLQGELLYAPPSPLPLVPFFGQKAFLGCDIVGLLQESKRPLPRKLRKMSEKGFPRPLGPGVKKTEKSWKWQFFKFFFGFLARFQLFLSFFDPGAERPREPLFRLFSEFSGERPFWPL